MDDFSSGKNLDLPLFDLTDIAAANENFSDGNKLGQGGFGSVYKVHNNSSVTSLKSYYIKVHN